MHTKQETFDVVARGILAQGGPGMQDRLLGYLQSNGRRCAGGHVMRVELYDTRINYLSASIAVQMVPGIFGEHDLQFVRSLQNIHDHWALHVVDADVTERERDAMFLAGWTRGMRDHAANHGLDASALGVER